MAQLVEREHQFVGVAPQPARRDWLLDRLERGRQALAEGRLAPVPNPVERGVEAPGGTRACGR